MLKKIVDKTFSFARVKTTIIWGIAFFLLNSILVGFIGPQFEKRTGGIKLPDMTIFIKPGQIYPAVTAFTPSDITYYICFSLYDFVFPVVGAVFYACLTAVLLKNLAVLKKNPWIGYVAVLPYFTALFDCIENVCYLTIIAALPQKIMALTYVTSFLMHIKVYNIWLTSSCIVILVLLRLAMFLMRKMSRS